MAYQVVSMNGLVQDIQDASDGTIQQRFCFILGAGASRESNIPTGQQLVDQWERELTDRNGEAHAAWKESLGIQDDNRYQFYSEYYARRYERNPRAGQNFLQRIMDRARPSCGYVILSHILANTKNNIVITTNFDHIMEDAVNYYQHRMPLVLGHEALVRHFDLGIQRPIVLKIHRDLLLDPKNTPQEVLELHADWAGVLDRIFREYHPVIVGYAGNDASLMGFLCGNAHRFQGHAEYRHPYWLQYRSSALDGRVHEFMAAAEGICVEHDGFDAVMVRIGDALGYALPTEDAFLQDARARYQQLEDAMEQLRRAWVGKPPMADDDADTDAAEQALANISQRSGKESASSMLLGVGSKPREKQDEVLASALARYPEDPFVLGTAAVVHHDRKEWDEAEALYRRAIEVDPNHATNLGNYALLLTDVRNAYDEAEALYRRAIEAGPKDANNLGNYANFLWQVRKSYDEAKALYAQAIEVDPSHANNLGNYAIFLERVRKSHDEAEALYKRAIEADPNHANNLGNYAEFLEKVRKSYDEAEALYKRSLEANPNSAYHLRSYGTFLQEVRNRPDEAEVLLKRAEEADEA